MEKLFYAPGARPRGALGPSPPHIVVWLKRSIWTVLQCVVEKGSGAPCGRVPGALNNYSMWWFLFLLVAYQDQPCHRFLKSPPPSLLFRLFFNILLNASKKKAYHVFLQALLHYFSPILIASVVFVFRPMGCAICIWFFINISCVFFLDQIFFCKCLTIVVEWLIYENISFNSHIPFYYYLLSTISFNFWKICLNLFGKNIFFLSSHFTNMTFILGRKVYTVIFWVPPSNFNQWRPLGFS